MKFCLDGTALNASHLLTIPATQGPETVHGSSSDFQEMFFSCFAVLLSILVHPYGFLHLEDSTVYFNYYNNFSHPHMTFFYAGYAALYPELVAYASRILPFWLQGAVYVLVSFAIGVFFVHELLRFLRHYVKERIVRCFLALVLVFVIMAMHTSNNLFVNLTYSIWIALLGFNLRVLNIIKGTKIGVLPLSVCALATLSNPLCLSSLPVLAVICLVKWKSRDKGTALECGVYIAALCFSFAFLLDHESALHASLLDIVNKALFYLHTGLNIAGLCMVAASVVLSAFLINTLFTFGREPGRRKDVDLCVQFVLAYFGLASVLMFVASSRFIEFNYIQPRYTLPVLVYAVLSLMLLPVMHAQRLPFNGVRTMFGFERQYSPVVVVVVVLVFVFAGRLIGGPQESVASLITRYRFLDAAQQFRRTCSSGVLSYRPDIWSTVVLCHPIAESDSESLAALNRSSAVVLWRGETARSTVGALGPQTPRLYLGAPTHWP